MVLVDTSVWVAHFRKADARLTKHLDAGEVATHPYIIGELACGGLSNRTEIHLLLQELPAAPVLPEQEFLHFLATNELAGQGIGFVDIHLLGSAVLNGDFLWTLDKKLDALARKLKVALR